MSWGAERISLGEPAGQDDHLGGEATAAASGAVTAGSPAARGRRHLRWPVRDGT
jgi:hypothetical protein